MTESRRKLSSSEQGARKSRPERMRNERVHIEATTNVTWGRWHAFEIKRGKDNSDRKERRKGISGIEKKMGCVHYRTLRVEEDVNSPLGIKLRGGRGDLRAKEAGKRVVRNEGKSTEGGGGGGWRPEILGPSPLSKAEF